MIIKVIYHEIRTESPILKLKLMAHSEKEN